MADVTGPISSLPGAIHSVSEGEVCDFHQDRPATVRIQGETDSFGCEMHDLCDECAKKMYAELRKPDIGQCDWCKAKNVRRGPRRDSDEGMYGPVYYVCKPCIDKDEARLQAENDYYRGRYGD